jgi:hypothetical protein
LGPVKVAAEFDQLRNDAGPVRPVAGSKARAIVTVEINCTNATLDAESDCRGSRFDESFPRWFRGS